MLLLHLNKSGSSTQQGSIRQLQTAELINSSSLQVPETIKPITAEEGLFREYLIQFPKMDPSTKKRPKPNFMPMPEFLVNNPNISIIPARNNQSPNTPLREPPVSTINRVPQSLPATPPVSVVPIKKPETSKCNDSKETKTSLKRHGSNLIINKPMKIAKLNTSSKSPKKKERKVDPTLYDVSKLISPNKTNNHPKNLDRSPKITTNNATESIPSTSSSKTQVSQESISQPTTKESTNLDVNSNSNSSVFGTSTVLNEIEREFEISSDRKLKIDNYTTHVRQYEESDIILVRTRRQLLKIKQPQIVNQLLVTFGEALKKVLTKDEVDNFSKQNSDFIHSLEDKSASETNDVLSINSKSNSANHNNVSNTKNQIHSQRASKPQPLTNNKQPNSSSKMQQTIKQNNSKHSVSSVPVLPITTVQNKSVNKVIIDNQQPSTSKSTASVSVSSSITNKKDIGKLPSKPELKKCPKCGRLTEDLCPFCRISCELKGVTVTLIETPGVRPSDPSDDNTVTNDNIGTIEIISSEDEDECSMKINIKEPLVYKTESKDALNKHLEKLRLNPKLLEEKLWNKDLGIKDFYMFEKCNTLRVGNYNTEAAGDLFICLHGVRMVINNYDSEPVTIDLPIDYIPKLYVFYGNDPFIFIYPNHLAGVGIRYLLGMRDTNKKSYFDPLSSDFIIKTIFWSFELQKTEPLENLMLKLPKEKYGLLTFSEAKEIRKINLLSSNTTVMKTNSQSETREMKNEEYQNIVIISENCVDSKVEIKINDYSTLHEEEFLNDKLVEFHLKYYHKNLLSHEDHKRTYVFSTYFYTTLSKKGPVENPRNSLTRFQRVKKWTKNVNIFKKDFIFIPVNENFHWYVVVVCFPYLDGPVYFDGSPAYHPLPSENEELIDRNTIYSCDTIDRDEADGNTEDLWFYCINYQKKIGTDYGNDVKKIIEKRKPIKQPCILVFDSLSGGTSRARVVATIRGWLKEEYQAKHDGCVKDFSKSVVKGGLIKVPQQYNFTDCGLFVMHYFEMFFEKPIVDYTFPITHLENWFHPDDISKNSQKRRYIQGLILHSMDRHGKKLPSGIELPVIRFSDSKTKIHNYSHNNNQFPNQNTPSVNTENLEGDIEETYEEEEEDDEENNLLEEDDDYDYGSYPNSAYLDYAHIMEPNEEYNPEEGIEEQWPHGSQNVDYHSEEEDSEGIDEYHEYHPSNDNIIVDAHNIINQRHLRNAPLVHNGRYGSHFQRDDDDDEEEDDDDDDVEYDDDVDNSVNHDSNESNESANISYRQNQRNLRFNHHN